MNRSFGGTVLALAGIVVACIVFSACTKREQATAQHPLTDRAVDSLLSLSQKYEIESGIVEYELYGLKAGTMTLYFDRYGMREARHSNTDYCIGMTPTGQWAMELEMNHNELSIGQYEYTIDLDSATGSVKQRPEAILVRELGTPFTPAQWKEFITSASGFEPSDSGTVLDRPCDGWTMMNDGDKYWTWKGVVLKWQNVKPEAVVLKAYRFHENAALPPDIFAVPDSITFDRNIE